jgi:TIR domain
MGYQYDIFLSYKHNDAFVAWLDECFLPCLKQFIALVTGREIAVFLDKEQIPPDEKKWMGRLDRGMGQSRCLIAIWSPSYFTSPWCLRECAAFEGRIKRNEKKSGQSLIFPVAIHNGLHFPPFARAMSIFDLREFNYPLLRKSEQFSRFERRMQTLVHELAPVITEGPPWRPQWVSSVWITRSMKSLQRYPTPPVKLPVF